MQEKLNFIDHTVGGEDFMRAAAKEAPTKKSKSSSQPRSLESIKQERSKLATKGKSVDCQRHSRMTPLSSSSRSTRTC